jgi:hypothetical protein
MVDFNGNRVQAFGRGRESVGTESIRTMSENNKGEKVEKHVDGWKLLKEWSRQPDLGEIVKDMTLEDVQHAICLSLIEIARKLDKLCTVLETRFQLKPAGEVRPAVFKRTDSVSAYRQVSCVICGSHPKDRREYARWVEGVCVRCQKRYGVR